MDTIQRELIKVGRKDLAQEYFLKYFTKKAISLKKSRYPQGEDKLNNVQPDSARKIALANVRVYFNDQKLMNLWENELSGQFSDGAWENTPSADWLWKDVAIARGPRNEIVIHSDYIAKKKGFNFKQLLDIPEVQQRMIVGNGFNNLNELKSALQTIKQMIANPRIDASLYHERVKEEKTVEEEKKARLENWYQSQQIFKKDNYGNIEYRIPGRSYINLRVMEVRQGGNLRISFGTKSVIIVNEKNVDDIVKIFTDLSSKSEVYFG